MRSSLVSIILALTAYGCATSTTPITMQSGTPVPATRIHHTELTVPAPGRTAKVSFLRDSGAIGVACVHKIVVDGRAVFSIRAGEYQTLYLAPGQHSFALEIEGGICPGFSASHSAVLTDGGEETYRIFSPSPTSRPRVAILETRDANIRAVSAEPAFQWDSEYSGPGVSLVLKENSRRISSNGTVVEYGLTASGFPAERTATLWSKRGTSFSRLPATINADGTVEALGRKSLIVEGFVPGQPLDLALESGTHRAHAKTHPFPIAAKQGDYWVLVELTTETGLVFRVACGGFQPGENVQITSQYKDERPVKIVEASPKGDLRFPVMFGSGDRGIASITAAGRSGTVSIQYKIGADALRRE